jgi:hypothetical protein
MLLQGTIYDITEREKYTRIVVVVETGFQSDVYLFRVTAELQDEIELGAGVLLSGNYTTRDGCRRFVLESIIRCEFKSCDICKLPLTAEQCVLKHNNEIQRLKGKWIVLYKNYSRGYLEFFLQKDDMVFPITIASKSWLYNLLDDITQDDVVEIEGWRHKDKTILTACGKVDYRDVI